MEAKEYILIQLSGTSMNGFRVSVDRSWALKATQEELIATLKNEMALVGQRYNIFELIDASRYAKLHIHAKYGLDSQTIYICCC
jgi:hypothetical protein